MGWPAQLPLEAARHAAQTAWREKITHYDVIQLYTEQARQLCVIQFFFRYPQGLEAFFESWEHLRPNLRILDAGCGTAFAS